MNVIKLASMVLTAEFHVTGIKSREIYECLVLRLTAHKEIEDPTLYKAIQPT